METDLISSCQDKLQYFRIKELKDILSQLGVGKQGKKQDLRERIVALLSDDQVSSKQHGCGKKNSIDKEGVAKIIDDTYRKMQDPGATDLASIARSGPDLNNVKEEVVESFNRVTKIRCLCGSSLEKDSMIQCEDTRCHVWQHICCVIIPEKPVDGVLPEVPPQFYCEMCRIKRADPFLVTEAQPLLPVKLTPSNVAADGTNQVKTDEKTFQLTSLDRDKLQKAEYDLQAWCILLNDKVPFRMQWPQYADLLVNGAAIRTTNRPGSQLLGINGRDDGPAIMGYVKEGINRISLARCDARIFCLGVRIIKRQTVQQVLNLIPKEADGERFEDALARVCRCIGGGTAAETADSDSDLEVVADSFTVNLRCPMSGSRMKIAGRFKPCVHMGCFDLETFVELNQRSRKWQCPICLKNYSLENIIIDPYFNRITSLMRQCGEDVTEIDVKTDGSWRAKNETEHRVLAQWHLPDSSLCAITDTEVKPVSEISKQIKQEGVSEGHSGLKLGIKRNHNGIWEVSKPEDMRHLSSGNHLPEKFENNCQQNIPLSGSATGSYIDGEDPSVDQEGGGPFDFSINNGNEFDSLSLNFHPTYNSVNRLHSAPSMDADVIVLSDSEEDNVTLISPETVYDTCPADDRGIPFRVPAPGVPESYPEDPGLDPSLSIFNNAVDDFGMPLWSLSTGSQAQSGFQLFGADDVSETLVDVQNTSVTLSAPTNGYELASDRGIGSASQAQDPSICRPNAEINGSLVDNPLAFGGDDPSLQIFLPTRPAGLPAQADISDHADASNGISAEDWISLRLGDGSSRDDSAAMNGLNTRHQFPSKEDNMETLANTASLLLSMNGDRSDKATTIRPRSDGPYSHPSQPRSVRPRLYFSIESDSE